jgi:sporulation-control protein spo0M
MAIVTDLDEEGLDIWLNLGRRSRGKRHAIVPLLLLNGGSDQKVYQEKETDINERGNAKLGLIFLKCGSSTMSGHGISSPCLC